MRQADSALLPLLAPVDHATVTQDERLALERAIRTLPVDHRGELPTTLQELVPEYLAEVPVDALSGGHLLYMRDFDAYRIYSVGSNRKDDGGADLIDRGSGSPRLVRGRDIGVRVLIRPQ